MARNLYYEDETVKTHFNKEMLGWLFSYIRKRRRTYLTILGLLISGTLLSLVPAALNMQIINRVLPVNGVVPGGSLTVAVIIITACAGVFAGDVAVNYFGQKLANRMGNDIVYEMRSQLYQKLMRLGFDYYDGHPAGKILVRVTNYVDEVANIFINCLSDILLRCGTMLLSLLAVVLIDVRLAAVVLVSMCFLSLIIFKLAKELSRRAEIDRNKNSNRMAFLAENINGLSVVKAFNREALNDEIHKELNETYRNAFLYTTRVREIFFPLSHGIVRLSCVILIYAVSLLIVTYGGPGELTLGALVSVTTYMQIFSEAVFNVCQRLQDISVLTTNLEKIYDTMEAEENVTEAKGSYSLPEIKGEVEFRKVTFSYDGIENVLEDFSLRVNPGSTIALIGPTGVGKTTVINLLNRFYDIGSGTILVDGHDIRDVTLDSLRGQIGVMMQEGFIFQGSILENIRFARPDATDSECMEAARQALAEDFILKLPDGYATIISENSSLVSGGERQMLSFARLILQNPRMIILDEATSSIDSETEQRIQKAIKKVLEGRTSFVIAHRLSTIQDADTILYIDSKNIREMGTHQELLDRKGKYFRLLKAGETN